MKLHDFPLSGNCHKVRLMLSFLGLQAELVPVDLAGGAHRREDFLALNPLGQVPVLEDGAVVLRDSQAILLYLARAHDRSGKWLPTDAAGLGRVGGWLALSACEINGGPAALRLAELFGARIDLEAARQKASQACDLIEARLASGPWLLEGDHPSVADVACYPYLALAGDGKWSLEPYPRLRAWLQRVEALPGFQPLQAAVTAG